MYLQDPFEEGLALTGGLSGDSETSELFLWNLSCPRYALQARHLDLDVHDHDDGMVFKEASLGKLPQLPVTSLTHNWHEERGRSIKQTLLLMEVLFGGWRRALDTALLRAYNKIMARTSSSLHPSAPIWGNVMRL